MTTYDIKTDLDPETLTLVAAETYRQWLRFALGQEAIGGKTLQHPSGRYAAALSWQKTGQSSIALIADENAAKEVDWIEDGRSAGNMKEAMLSGGKVGADGYRYRTVPIRDEPGSLKFNMRNIGGGKNGEHLPKGLRTLWGAPRAGTDAARYVTMSDRPGSSEWKIPAMAAYAPAAILAELLRGKYGSPG